MQGNLLPTTQFDISREHICRYIGQHKCRDTEPDPESEREWHSEDICHEEIDHYHVHEEETIGESCGEYEESVIEPSSDVSRIWERDHDDSYEDRNPREVIWSHWPRVRPVPSITDE